MHKRLNYPFMLALIIITGVGFFVITYAQQVIAEIEEYDLAMSQHFAIDPPKKPEAIVAKGLYLTAFSAANPKKRAEIIDLTKRTELNAVVIDIKDYSGYVLYDSMLPLVDELNTDRDTLKNIRTIVKEFKDAGMYVIARQTVFQDPVLARANPEWAIRTADGSLWRDYKGLSWVDPTKEEVWRYNMNIAKEAISYGFDEINFDYIRFPSDGNIRTAVYANVQESKEKTIRTFNQYVRKQLRNQPAYTSFDLFGLTLEAKNFDLNIGQRLDTAKDAVDYIYPMTYPSHYPPGHLSYQNPADFPYEVVHNGLVKAEPTMALSRTKLRPWIQAFDLGAVYDGTKIRAQIKAAEESPLTSGWMLWNASNRYSTAGLLPENN
ncbi:MAG: putative glycoside hydrolase [Candidatus Komeilibacteria bacterium]|nr:putative glycoside hydrolase [Candidatus Komeilibacteria bacterium]